MLKSLTSVKIIRTSTKFPILLKQYASNQSLTKSIDTKKPYELEKLDSLKIIELEINNFLRRTKKRLPKSSGIS
ncbi:hypothetical protein IJQ19_01600 [bacterium]|nr:hypothetical protein [bacterium]